MKKTNVNFVVDAAALVAFALLSTTGVLMRYLLPPGSGHQVAIWGLDRHEWGGVHFWTSVSLFALLAVHLVLHWRWIACVVAGRRSEQSGIRAGLGVVGLLATLAIAAAPLFAPIQPKSEPDGAASLSSHSDEELQIRGSMTLADVERVTGMPPDELLGALELPATTPRDEQLGRLRRQYGFEMSEVRAAIKSYSASR